MMAQRAQQQQQAAPDQQQPQEAASYEQPFQQQLNVPEDLATRSEKPYVRLSQA
jgi:hypothetical protein